MFRKEEEEYCYCNSVQLLKNSIRATGKVQSAKCCRTGRSANHHWYNKHTQFVSRQDGVR